MRFRQPAGWRGRTKEGTTPLTIRQPASVGRISFRHENDPVNTEAAKASPA